MLISLSGITVVDLSRVLAGPLCTQILADHGAEVIKVEPPQGDETRTYGPPFVAGSGAYFYGLNRNKTTTSALDLKRAEGGEVVLRLLEKADVLIENFLPGTMGSGARLPRPAALSCCSHLQPHHSCSDSLPFPY